MKIKLLQTFILLSLSISSFAEGQDGLQIFVFIINVLAICLYTFVGGIVFKIIYNLIIRKNSKSNWFYFGIAFLITLILALFFGDDFIPF